MADVDFNKHLEIVKQEFEQRTADKPVLAPEQEKQIIKEIIKEKFTAQPAVQSDAVSQPVAPAPVPQPIAQPAVNLQEAEQQRIIEQLIDLALRQGVDKAVQEANSTNNPYLLDRFHDVLVDKFYSEIKAQQR